MRLRIAMLRQVAALAIAGAASASLFAADRQLLNGWDVRNEIHLAPGVNPAVVKDYFPSFYDYLDTVLFHPTAGYYSAGAWISRIITGPSRARWHLSSGTWSPSRCSGCGMECARRELSVPSEKFTIAEFGAGDGAMAESVLDYIDHQAATNPDPRWREFKQQAIYACYDRSPALSEIQRKRNSRFGERFHARQGDATNPRATIARGSLKGVFSPTNCPIASACTR